MATHEAPAERTYLTCQEAATVLGVDRHSVVQMVDDCTIPTRYVYRVGKRRDLRIHKDAFASNPDPTHALPHPQTHSLIALLDRVITNAENDLDDLRRTRDLVQKGVPWTPRLLPSSLAAD